MWPACRREHQNRGLEGGSARVRPGQHGNGQRVFASSRVGLLVCVLACVIAHSLALLLASMFASERANDFLLVLGRYLGPLGGSRARVLLCSCMFF